MEAKTTSTTDLTNDSDNKGESSADESGDTKNSEVTENIDPVTSPELANKDPDPKEAIHNSPSDGTESIDTPVETSVDLAGNHGHGAPDTAEHDVKMLEAANAELTNEDNPEEPINDPPPDMTEPINGPPEADVGVAENRGHDAPDTAETDVKKPEATIDKGPVTNAELNEDNPEEPINDPPPDMTEPVNEPPEADVGVAENGGHGAPDTAETDVKKPKATKKKGPMTNAGLTNEENPKKLINRPPETDLESRKVAESSRNTKKRENKPKTLDFSKMPLKEKRSYYRCGRDYVTLDKIMPWPDYVKDNLWWLTKIGLLERDAEFTSEFDHENRKVSLWKGDITCLEIDAIVNAANTSLRGGGGVDGCIHRAAGKGLLDECIKLDGCDTGKAKITSGHRLPAKHVIHTVGPIGEREKLLESCYISCLTLMKKHGLSSMAFCSISTGIYGYPNRKAARVALRTVKRWLENNKDWVGRIIFCVFLQDDEEVYQQLMLEYFPCTLEKKKEKKSGNDDMASKKEPNSITTEVEKPHRSRGRGRGRGTQNTSEKKAPSTLLSVAVETKTDPPKGKDGSPAIGTEPERAVNAGSSSSASKEKSDKGKMDTSKGDGSVRATVGSGIHEITAGKRENEETSSDGPPDTKCMKTCPGGDLSGDSVAVGASENFGASEDGSKMSAAVGREPENAGNASSSFRESEDVIDDEMEKMDTLEDNTDDTATVRSEVPETKADKKENEETSNDDPPNTKCLKTCPGGDLSGDSVAGGASENFGANEDGPKTSAAVRREPEHAGNVSSSFRESEDVIPEEEKMDTLEDNTDDTATVRGEAPETKADKKENEETTNDDPADPNSHPGGDPNGENGADDGREGSQPESMEIDEASEETGASVEVHEMSDGKEGHQEDEGGTISDESNEGDWQIVKNKKKSRVKITSKV